MLTNNHVINGATKIEVEVGVTGDTYTAKVLGYDVEDDVALLKLNDAEGMETISTASASSVSRNDAIVAIGNALGRFGEPAVVAGTVSALHQQVTAGDGLDEETLSDMIRIAASIQPGRLGRCAGERRGQGDRDEHRGRRRLRPVRLPGRDHRLRDPDRQRHLNRRGDQGRRHLERRAHRRPRAARHRARGPVVRRWPFGSGDGGTTTAGAGVADVSSGSPADDAGLEAGDTITALGSESIGSIDDLRAVMDTFHPGDEVRVTWTDVSGERHRATVTLVKGPPA